MILRARTVLPISQPPIADGAVRISAKRISAVGPFRNLRRRQREEVFNLGDVVLMPGLINAHCHLDYTKMAGEFPPPKVFTDWLKTITSTKAGWGYSDYAESWLAGARMLARTGTTTVADFEAVPQLLPHVWESTPLRIFSFLELIGITKRRPPAAVIAEALKRIRSLKHSRCRVAFSPHAPYSTVPELLRLCAQIARRRKWPLCTHVAESKLEFQMFAHGSGEMFDWLRRSARDMSDCGSGSPVQHLERCKAVAKNLLAVHANYLAKKDAALLGTRLANVVHCPRSHSYFGHDPFPLRSLVRSKVNVCLGTDSLASVYKARGKAVELNLFEEMRALAGDQPWIGAKTITRMATINGARALGMTKQVGELCKGAYADLIAIPFSGKIADIYDAILHHAGDVSASMIDGQWVINPAAAARHELL